MFFRKIETKLNEYYKNNDDRIIIVTGARQIGKSFIIRETAQAYFKNYIEINMQEDRDGDEYFKDIKTTKDFYLQLSALYGEKLNDVKDTIVFIDEIQVYPHLLTLLKPLKKDNKFRYIASGSLLGITLKHEFIPMGSIEEVKMYPMDFEEFLLANGTSDEVIKYLKDCYENKKQVKESIHNLMLNRFKEYLICGGLPDAVKEFIINQNVAKMRNVQNDIYGYYKDDASKYDEEHKLKIKTIYDYLPSYMENKVKRIIFKNIEDIKNANLKRYEDEFDYLISSGISLGVKAILNPIYPLTESISKNLIKLYYNDVGILSNLLYKNNINAILKNDVNVNLGSVYETACAMELSAHGHELYYFDSKKVGEVDFLINDYNNLTILPIEIKSGDDQYNFKAIPKLVKEPYNLKKGLIFGNENIIVEKDNLITFPIYMIMFL